MQPPPRIAALTTPQVFHHSLDWRFLLPIADLHKGFFLFDDDVELSQALEHVGIHPSQRLSFADFRNPKNGKIPFLVSPLGLPTGLVGARSAARVEFYYSARRLLAIGGTLLVGFNNNLRWHDHSGRKYHSLTPHRLEKELKQAGFASVEIFGAMPNLHIPEYIFELSPRSLRFALQNRFRRKPAVLRVLRVLSGTFGWKSLSHFLPCYFAVATV